jgi:7-cyano-7-deazaguanine synthase
MASGESTMMSDHSLVLFSGGQDSTVCLAWALTQFASVETIGFTYGQRHMVEMDCRLTVRAKIARAFPAWRDRLGQDHVLDLSVLGNISTSALTRPTAIAAPPDALPNTFVPGRNLLFLTFAAAVAYQRGCKHLVGGMCEADFSGYPDCRDDTLKALQVALNLGMDQRFVIQTPLMWRDKAATWELAEQLGGTTFIELVRTETHSCYEGVRDMLHDWGYGCGVCPACELRRNGYARYMSSRT